MADTTLDARPTAPTSSPVQRRIHDLAAEHGVVYAATAFDLLANAHARLSDNDVTLDETENLVTALERAGVVTEEEGRRLHSAYLRELGLT